MSILVFDIETVPDLSSARQLYHLDPLSDEDAAAALLQLRREKVGHDFLPLHLQRIVAISLVMVKGNTHRVWSLGEPGDDEKSLIQRFFDGIEKHTPVLVSWNGSGFDLPVLHYRALLHQVAAPTYWEMGENLSAFKWNNYLNRYHYRHLDLMDVLAAYQNKAYAPLDEIAIMLGFPGKIGLHGSRVFEAFQQGNLDAIRNYCEIDVLNTYGVYLRFEVLRGKISTNECNEQLLHLQHYLERSPEKAHWQEFAQKLPLRTPP